ncbi:hypothetical protein C5167_029620 [Papaver somniferum]|nr:hypothetical protein C5167_029620 [Papaver somniferum]
MNFTASRTSPCKWYGITCNDEGRVAELHINGLGLQGINNFTQLKELCVGDNKLNGYLPQNACQSGILEVVVVTRNYFTGPIPRGIRNCTTLKVFEIFGNELVDYVTEAFHVYPNLLRFVVGNNITGKIPSEMGKMKMLGHLFLGSNNLVGKIPEELLKLSSLICLDLSNNQLSGKLSFATGMFSNLQCLDLSTNKLIGSIPKQLGECSKLLSLNLSRNNFNESIPPQIGNLDSLQIELDLSYNELSGEIPSDLGKLSKLQMLNLSHYKLFGSIPSSFIQMLSLTSVNISDNELSGPLPSIKAFKDAPADALKNNKGLCGNNSKGLKPCDSSVVIRRKKDKHKPLLVILLPLIGSLFLLFILFAILLRLRKRSVTIEVPISQERTTNAGRDLFSIWNYDGKIVFEDIIEATEGFDTKYCIGTGGYGSVYKAELSTGQVVAVKKLHSPDEDCEIADLKSFESEIHALTEIRHWNIVKLFGFCSNPRVRFIKGTASALACMHHDCIPAIVHRDISSNNILLDSEYDARVSDFELAYTMKVTEKCDVYSFGVIILEVLMGTDLVDLKKF